jgi:DnaJ homolog subfamily C member 19
MMTKFILALLVAYAGYRLWKGFGKPRPAVAAPRAGDALAEARATLGVPPNADADTIRAAHRRLVADVHPDRGGSAEQARQVNAARDTLLKSLG